jgi:aerobic carbon-monoxide dehydrogenase large subunit
MRANSDNSGIGQPVRRREDFRLLTGKGCYSDDFSFPGQAYAVMVRSPHAHALIRSVDTAAAAAAPGVLAVLTGRDLLADGLQAIPHSVGTRHPADITLVNKDGSPPFIPPHFPTTAHEARHCGEIVAMVVATTVAGAKDGAELVDVDYEPLPAVTHSMVAVQPGAPLARGDATSNISIDAEIGDPAATNAAFSTAAHIVKFETWVQRIAGVPMEPRAATGIYDRNTGRYALYAGIGGAVRPKQELAKILGVAEDKVRVVMHEVGGNFGTRGSFNPEFALVTWAARHVGRPVKWTCERQEAFLCDYQGARSGGRGRAGARPRRQVYRNARLQYRQ